MSDFRLKRGGFTLIELSIVLLIIGIVVAGIMAPYNTYQQEKTRQTTVDNVQRVEQALNEFLLQNGRYPCPAPLNAALGDDDYGMESECDSGESGYPSTSTGQCDDGLCFEAGDGTGPDRIVRRGAVPFRTLGLMETESIDGYDTRLQYAVTEKLATDEFSPNDGKISIVDTDGDSVIGSTFAHYVVFSTGKNKSGAYSRGGAPAQSCNTTFADSPNCDIGGSGSAEDAIYVVGMQNETGDSNEYDDFLSYQTFSNGLWRVSGPRSQDITSVLTDNKAKVGIGVPNPWERLVAQKDIKVSEDQFGTTGTMLTNQLCNYFGEDCFPVDDFGRVSENLRCGETGDTYTGNNDLYATGFNSGKIKCADNTARRCPSGEVLRGIDSNGELICDTPYIACPEKNVTLCPAEETTDSDDHYTLPETPYQSPWDNSSNYHTTPISGESYREQWRCGPDGKWRFPPESSGTCTCEAETETYQAACNDFKDGNWSGNVTLTRETTCPSGDIDLDVNDDQCTCQDFTLQETKDCPAGYDGTYTRENEWSCSGSGGSWSGWSDNMSSACSCDSSAERTRTLSCPDGYDFREDAEVLQTSQFSCGSNSWGPWQTDSSNCSSDCYGEIETKIEACSGGERLYERTFDCSSETWGAWTATTGCNVHQRRWIKIEPIYNKTNALYSSPAAEDAYDLCTSEPVGTIAECSQENADGDFRYYKCRCE